MSFLRGTNENIYAHRVKTLAASDGGGACAVCRIDLVAKRTTATVSYATTARSATCSHAAMDASRKQEHKDPLTVVVVAGAGARGAFEAAALAELLPVICPNGLSNTILLGTSAGAINVALWASRLAAGKALYDVGKEAEEVWLRIDRKSVYNVPLDSYALTAGAAAVDSNHAAVDQANDIAAGVARTLFGWIPLVPQVVDAGQALVRNGADEVFGVANHVVGHPFARTGALLDTGPLWKQARETVDFKALHANIAEGRLGGIGLVATSCPMDASGGRSRVFLHLNPKIPFPGNEKGSSIDYVQTETLNESHILASAAIPIVFPPIHVDAKKPYSGWYTDGGMRLNAPIEPGIKLNAQRIVVISSHPTSYPEPEAAERKPQVIDIGAQAVHSVLADAMIEDLRAVRRINKMIDDAGGEGVLKTEQGRPYRYIDLIEVSPPIGELSDAAEEVAKGTLPAADRGVLRFFARLSGENGKNELLSYLLFEKNYFLKQFKLGHACARQSALSRSGFRNQPTAR